MVMQSLLPTTAPQRVLHTTIAHVSKPTASDAHTYTQFLVRVSDERSPGLHWAVYRRYSEFRNLKLALEDAVANRDMCAHCAIMSTRTCFVRFPHRRLFGNLRAKTLETRRVGLTEFLDGVTKHARTCRESMTCQTRALMDKFLMVNDMRYTYLNVDMAAEAAPSTANAAGDKEQTVMATMKRKQETRQAKSGVQRGQLSSTAGRMDAHERDEAGRSCSEAWTSSRDERATGPTVDQARVDDTGSVVDPWGLDEQDHQLRGGLAVTHAATTTPPALRPGRTLQRSYTRCAPAAARQSLTSGWERATSTQQKSSSASRHSDPGGVALHELLNFTRGSFSRGGRPHRAESRLRLRKVHLSSAAKRVKKLEEAEARFGVPTQTRQPRRPPQLTSITEEG